MDYWGRKALYVRGAPEKFSGLFDRDRFYAAIERAYDDELADRFRIAALVEASSDRPLTLSFMRPISPDEVDASLRNGMTICVNDISAGDARLRALARTVRKELNYLGDVHFNCYLSPDESGAPFHIDSRMTTTLQVEGRKRWRFADEPAVRWPPSVAQLRNGAPEWLRPVEASWARLDRPDVESFREVVLEPGDLLCLPAGTWHEAEAKKGSLALNLSFGSIAFSVFVAMVLENRLSALDTWRGGVPPVVGAADGNGVPGALAPYLAERLRELRQVVDALDPDGDEIAAVWTDLRR